MYSLSLSRSLFGTAYLLSVSAAQNVVSLAPAAQPTPGSSFIISPSFAGFGIEPSNLYSFTGGESNPNELSFNLLRNLANYTGTPPHLRIGGNTQDYMIYESSMDDYVVEVNPNPTEDAAAWFPQNYYVFGPRFFEVLNRFPKDTPITYGLNLAYHESDAVDRNVQQAHAAYTQMTNLNLVSLEIGNEPDLYIEAGYRTGPWSGTLYTQEWLTRAQAVWERVLQPAGLNSNVFEAAQTASTIGTSFMINDLIQDGITAMASDSKPYLASWNQHDYYYYIGVSTYELDIDHFLDLPTTNAQFISWTEEVSSGLASGYPYALREMGVVGPIGMDGITNVFAAALWTLNFFLYTATLNISSVQMHMTDNSNASAWQPIPYYGNQPHVRPNYYAWAAFDQTIGPTCQARVSGYVIADPPSEYSGRIGAYSIYQDDTLASIVLINTRLAYASTANIPSLTVDLTLPPQFAGKTLHLSYLSAPGADSKSGTTWNGLSYETSGDGTATHVTGGVSTVKIGSDGTAKVTVRDSQAVVVNIGSQVGTLKPNHAACTKLGAARPDAYSVKGTAPDYSINTNSTSASASASAGVKPLPALYGIFGAACLSAFALL